MYPAFSKDFRSICKEYLQSKSAFITKLWVSSGRRTSRDADGAEEMSLEPTPHSTNAISPTFVNEEAQPMFEDPRVMLDEVSSHENIGATNKRYTITEPRNSNTSSSFSDIGSILSNNSWLKLSLTRVAQNGKRVKESMPCQMPINDLVTTPSSIAIAHHNCCSDL